MSATLSTFTRPAVTKRPGAVFQLLTTCCDGIAGYFVRRAAVAQLREADDHTLLDIGITRSQIEAAVYGSLTDQARM